MVTEKMVEQAVDKKAKGSTAILIAIMGKALKIIRKATPNDEQYQAKLNEMLDAVCASQGEEHREFYCKLLEAKAGISSLHKAEVPAET